MKFGNKKHIAIASILLSQISLFSLGFASFLIPGGDFISTTTNVFDTSFGDVNTNIKGVYVDDSSFNGFKYTSDNNLNYSYTKTTLDIGIQINKQELLTNEDNSILYIELLTNTNFFSLVSYDSSFNLYFDFDPNYSLKSSNIISITNGIMGYFYVKSNEYYDLEYFSNKFMVNQNVINLTLSLNFSSLPSTYNFLSTYQATTFTYRYNCEVI